MPATETRDEWIARTLADLRKTPVTPERLEALATLLPAPKVRAAR